MSSQDNLYERRHYSPSASITESMPRAVTAILTATALFSVSIAIYALGRAENASDQARIMERETRIMQDDLKYIRAYLSARGIEVPENHEQAEEKRK